MTCHFVSLVALTTTLGIAAATAQAQTPAQPAPAPAAPEDTAPPDAAPMDAADENAALKTAEQEAAEPKATPQPATTDTSVSSQLTAEKPAEMGRRDAMVDGHGITLEASVGIGTLSFIPEQPDGALEDEFPSHTYGARPGINAGIGVFASPSVAIGLRIAAVTTTLRDVEGTEMRLTSAFVGPTAQIWGSRDVFFGFGAGVAVAMTDIDIDDIDDGIAIDARLGYVVHATERHRLHVSAEIMPAFHDEATLLGAVFQLGWQML